MFFVFELFNAMHLYKVQTNHLPVFCFKPLSRCFIMRLTAISFTKLNQFIIHSRNKPFGMCQPLGKIATTQI